MYRFEPFFTIMGAFTVVLPFGCLSRRMELLAFLNYRLAS